MQHPDHAGCDWLCKNPNDCSDQHGAQCIERLQCTRLSSIMSKPEPRLHWTMRYNFWLGVFVGWFVVVGGLVLFGSYSKLHAFRCTHVFSLPNRIWLRKLMMFCTIFIGCRLWSPLFQIFVQFGYIHAQQTSLMKLFTMRSLLLNP